MAYDIIGDIHGQADKLHALLKKLGYRDQNGAYRHPSRMAIFVGDFIDRGPQQLETVRTARHMVEAGSALAVLGNHEFNAMAWHTEDPEHPGHFLRTRAGTLGAKNKAQHQAFLSEVEDQAALHAELVKWFYTLPLWLDLPHLRVVHACWHGEYMRRLHPVLTPARCLTPETLALASKAGHAVFQAVEGLTKGLEIPLPVPHSFHDKDGHVRDRVRTRWWDDTATHYRDLAMLSEELKLQVPNEPVPLEQRPVYAGVKPVFFGHYWMTGQPARQNKLAACVDYSAGKHGPLVAYRFDGEPEISNDQFVCSH